MCAAHLAALQAAVQELGGLAACTDDQRHIVLEELRVLASSFGLLLVEPSFTALASEAIARLAPVLSEVGLLCPCEGCCEVWSVNRKQLSSRTPRCVCAMLQVQQSRSAALELSGNFPQLAVAMAHSGTLQSLLAEAQRLQARGDAQAVRHTSPAKRCKAGCVSAVFAGRITNARLLVA